MTLKRIQVRISGLQGFTAVELVVVLLLMGTMAALAIPRAIKQTPQQEVDRAARQLVRDLEQARLRAMASKRVVRVAFYPAQGYYAAVALTTADGESTSEMSAEAADAYLLARGAGDGARSVDLPGRVTFGSGEATLDPLGAKPRPGTRCRCFRTRWSLGHAGWSGRWTVCAREGRSSWPTAMILTPSRP